MFVYKHTKTIEYVKRKPTFSEKKQTSLVSNSRILRDKNAKFPGCGFYMNPEYMVRLSNLH